MFCSINIVSSEFGIESNPTTRGPKTGPRPASSTPTILIISLTDRIHHRYPPLMEEEPFPPFPSLVSGPDFHVERFVQ